jgi:K+-transporting ATPase ATPase C chain
MLVHLRPAVVMIALFTLLTGLLYPLALTGLSQVLLSGPANGSLLRDSAGHVLGSSLIAQGFAKPQYLHPRISAAGNGYDPTASGGSNYGPLDPKLAQRVAGDAAGLSKDSPGYRIPVDAVTASASGLDPDISPENARLQAPRIAAARHVTVPDVQTVIDRLTKARTLVIFGEPRVNVLEVNLALDQALPVQK